MRVIVSDAMALRKHAFDFFPQMPIAHRLSLSLFAAQALPALFLLSFRALPAEAQSSSWTTVHQQASWYAGFVDHAISTRNAVVLDGQWRRMGWGAEVAARAADSCIGYLQGPIRRVTAPDTPVPFAPVMENFYVPSVERIITAVKEVCQ